GFSVFAASGILDDEFKHELIRRDLGSYFNEVCGGDKVGFLKSLKRKMFKRIIFVGDTEYDKKTAEDAKTEFFRVRRDSDILSIYDQLKK
ncbi:MAG: HAD family hydrolase, partial [Spirochaetes bacterium]|nr:HAD family hydrolase [Spirochaetota bacterium]